MAIQGSISNLSWSDLSGMAVQLGIRGAMHLDRLQLESLVTAKLGEADVNLDFPMSRPDVPWQQTTSSSVLRAARAAGLEPHQYSSYEEMGQAWGQVEDDPGRDKVTPEQMPASYDSVLAYGMGFGYSRVEIDQELKSAVVRGELQSGASLGEAREHLNQRYMRGYGETAKEFGISPHMIQYMPEHAMTRRAGAVPYERGEEVPPGYFTRKSEAHAWPTSSVTHASYLPLGPGGGIMSSRKVGELHRKMIKDVQRLHSHEMVRMAGLPDAPPFVPAGRMSQGVEPAQVFKGALVIGGSVGGPGAILMDPSVGQATQRAYREVGPEEAAKASWFAYRGMQWEPGKQMQLAGGMTPERTGKFGYRVLDVAKTAAGGYGFALERFADPTEARIRLASGTTKGAASIQKLGAFTDPQGRSLGLQFAGEFKASDTGALAYEWYRAQGTEALRGDIAKLRGVDPSQVSIGSFQEVGLEAQEAWGKYRAPSAIQTIQESRLMTEAAAQRFQEAGSLVGATQMGEGMTMATVQHQAIVGQFAKQASHLYPAREVFLSHEELQNLKAVDEPQYKKIWTQSVSERRAYRRVTNAMLASTGRYEMPRGVTAASDIPLGGMMVEAQKAAGAGASQPAIVRQFTKMMAKSEWGQSYIGVQTPAGQMVVPPPALLGKFGARGEFENEEMSRFVQGAYGLLSAQAGGGQEELKQAGFRYFEGIRELVSGESFSRKLTGARVPGGVGDIMRTSMALQPEEAYIPGLAAGAGQIFRQPTRGRESFDIQAKLLSREQAIERGVNLEEFTASMALVQAMAGDVDGDLGYAWRAGKIKQGPGGGLIGPRGEALTSSDDILASAKRARTEGAADVWSEMSGATTGTTVTLEQAKRQVRQSMTGQIELTAGEVEQNLRAGQELAQKIGPSYNVFRGAAGQVSEAATEAYQTVARTVHGFRQRPEELEPAQERLMSIANMSLWSKATQRQTGYTYSEAAGGPAAVAGGVRGAMGMMLGTHEALLSFGQEGGSRLSSRDIGLLMGGTPGRAQSIEKYTRALRNLPTDAPTSLSATLRGRISRAVGTPAQFLQSPMGAMMMPRAVERAFERGAPRGKIGLDPQAEELAMRMRGEQKERIRALRRAGEPTAGAFIDKIEAMRSVTGLEGVVQPLVAGGAEPASPVHAAVLRGDITPEDADQMAIAQAAEYSAGVANRGALGAQYRMGWGVVETSVPGGPSREMSTKVAEAAAGDIPLTQEQRARSQRRLGQFTAMPPRQPPPPGMPGFAMVGAEMPGGGGQAGGGQAAGGGSTRTGGGGWPRMGIAEFETNVNLLNRNLGQWAQKVGPAIEGTTQFTKEMEPLTKSIIGLAKKVQAGEQQEWDRPTARISGALGMAREWQATGAWGQVWQAQEVMGQRKITEQFGMLGGGPGGGGRGGRGGAEGFFNRMWGGAWTPPERGKPSGGGILGRLAQAERPLFSGFELMRLQRYWSILGAPVFQEQIPAAAQAQMGAYQAGVGIGGIQPGAFPGGAAGGLMAYQAQREAGMIRAGQIGYAAYGAGGPSAGRDVQALLGPAAAWGLQAGGVATMAAAPFFAGGMSAAMGAVGMPLGIGVFAGVGLNAARNYVTSRADPTMQNQMRLAAAYGGRGREGQLPLGAIPDLLGALAPTWAGGQGVSFIDTFRGGPSGLQAWTERQIEGGERGVLTPLEGLGAEERGAAIERLSEMLRERGGVWKTIGPDRLTQMMGAAAPYLQDEFAGMGVEQLAADMPELIKIMAQTGREPQQFQELADQLKLGVFGGADILTEIGRLPAGQQMQAAKVMGQWAPLVQLGMSGQDILGGAVSPFQTLEARGQAQGRAGAFGQTIAGVLPFFGASARKLGPLAQQAVGAEPLAYPKLGIREQARMGQFLPTAQALMARGRDLDLPDPDASPEEKLAWLNQQYEQLPRMRAEEQLGGTFMQMGISPGRADLAVQAAGRVGGMTGIRGTQAFLGGDRFVASMIGQANVGGPGAEAGQIFKDSMLAALQSWMPSEEFKKISAMADAIKPLMEVKTGLPMGTTEMWKGFAGQQMMQFRMTGRMEQLGLDPGTMEGLGGLAETGGLRALQLREQELRNQLQERGYQREGERLELQGVSQFGGRFEYPGVGTLETRGSFAIQEELRKLSRIWEDFTQDYNNQSRQLAYNQFMENLGVQQARMPVQFGWQREDIAFQGQQAAMQFGWQMEDIEENLRFASGRQRRQILRQQERASIMFGMGQGRRETLGGRIDVREQWAEEDIERQRRHYEERFALGDEFQARQREYIQERRVLEDELQMIREFNAQYAQQAAQEDLQFKQMINNELKAINAWYTAIQHGIQDAGGHLANTITTINWLASQFEEGGDAYEAWRGFVSYMVSSLSEAQNTSLDYGSGGYGSKR